MKRLTKIFLLLGLLIPGPLVVKQQQVVVGLLGGVRAFQHQNIRQHHHHLSLLSSFCRHRDCNTDHISDEDYVQLIVGVGTPFFKNRQRRGWRLSTRLRLTAVATAEDSNSTVVVNANEENNNNDDDDFDNHINSTISDDLQELPPGLTPGFFVTQQYTLTTADGENKSFHNLQELLGREHFQRLKITPSNLTIPIALILLDPETYPSLSRARKACRKGSILVTRRNNMVSEKQEGAETAVTFNDKLTTTMAKVADRLYPGDIVGKQVRIGSGHYSDILSSQKKPPFELPVIHEDDHMALVYKPSGVVVYKQNKGGHGLMTVRAALPFALQPPRPGTFSVLRRPGAVHRLDKPTSGLLLVAKTKPARMDLSRQFHDRIVQKTYTAIANGIPEEGIISTETTRSITSKEAYDLGVDVDPSDYDTTWQLIDSPLDGKHAVTVWRAVRYVKSLHAKDGFLTLVELKPKTGRFHQLRRHMAWVCGCALVGDATYDGGTAQALKFRDRGLFLTSNKITLEHPFYNTCPDGRAMWEESLLAHSQETKHMNSTICYCEENDKVMVTASVDLPEKFSSLLRHEEERYNKFNN